MLINPLFLFIHNFSFFKMSNIITDSIQLIRQLIPSEDQFFLNQVALAFSCSFLAIYSILLLTDGYYFLVFLVTGFGLGGFYFNNKDGHLEMEKYERHVSVSENTLEQVKEKKNKTLFMHYF